MYIDLDISTIEPIVVKSKIDIEAVIRYKLPSLPGTAMRVLGLLRDVNTPARKLAEAVGCDPSLTTRVLRLANSPIYALQKNVSSLNQAVDVVGSKYLYDIVIMNLTSVVFADEIRAVALARVVWEHSLAVALLAREFSRTLGMRDDDEIFICGLLHDIGKIMLLRADVETYSKITEISGEKAMLDAEIAAFGYTHSQIGSFVVRHWCLPDNISHSILSHHDHSQSFEAGLTSHLVNIADKVANYYGYGLNQAHQTALTDSQSASVLRLSDEQLHKGWEKIQPHLTEVARAFD